MIGLTMIGIWIIAIITTFATVYLGIQHYLFRIYPRTLINILFIVSVVLWAYLLLDSVVDLIKNDIYYQTMLFFVVLAYILFMPKNKTPKKRK